jgi:hypothetical protein
MPRHRKKHVRPLHDVFKMIDMRGGDVNQCWPWQGAMSPHPIFCWNAKRLQARRVVWALRNAIHPDNAPRITTTCGNERCLNPAHLIPEHGIIHKLVRAGEISVDDASSLALLTSKENVLL